MGKEERGRKGGREDRGGTVGERGREEQEGRLGETGEVRDGGRAVK